MNALPLPVQLVLRMLIAGIAFLTVAAAAIVFLGHAGWKASGQPASLEVVLQVLREVPVRLLSPGDHFVLLPPYIVLWVTLSAIIYCELRFRIIPYTLTLPTAIIGVLLTGVTHHISLLNSLSGLILGALGIRGLNRTYAKQTGEVGMGGGIAYLMGMLGAFIGLPYSVVVLMSASLAALLYILGMRLLGTKVDGLEFGPWIAAFGLLGGLIQYATLISGIG